MMNHFVIIINVSMCVYDVYVSLHVCEYGYKGAMSGDTLTPILYESVSSPTAMYACKCLRNSHISVGVLD